MKILSLLIKSHQLIFHQILVKSRVFQDPGVSNEIPHGHYPPYDEGLKFDIFIKNPNGSGPIVGVVSSGQF